MSHVSCAPDPGRGLSTVQARAARVRDAYQPCRAQKAPYRLHAVNSVLPSECAQRGEGSWITRPLQRCSPYTRLVFTPNLSPVHSERASSQNETNSQRPCRRHCVKGGGGI